MTQTTPRTPAQPFYTLDFPEPPPHRVWILLAWVGVGLIMLLLSATVTLQFDHSPLAEGVGQVTSLVCLAAVLAVCGGRALLTVRRAQFRRRYGLTLRYTRAGKARQVFVMLSPADRERLETQAIALHSAVTLHLDQGTLTLQAGELTGVQGLARTG